MQLVGGVTRLIDGSARSEIGVRCMVLVWPATFHYVEAVLGTR